jgi:hypothetical protein
MELINSREHIIWGRRGAPGSAPLITVRLEPENIKISHPEAEFLDVIGTKVSRVFLLAINSHLY